MNSSGAPDASPTKAPTMAPCAAARCAAPAMLVTRAARPRGFAREAGCCRRDVDLCKPNACLGNIRLQMVMIVCFDFCQVLQVGVRAHQFILSVITDQFSSGRPWHFC